MPPHARSRTSKPAYSDGATLQALEAGGRAQVGRNCVASLATLFVCRCTALRQRRLRPQLKRDPLGRTIRLVAILSWARMLRLACALSFRVLRALAAPVPSDWREAMGRRDRLELQSGG